MPPINVIRPFVLLAGGAAALAVAIVPPLEPDMLALAVTLLGAEGLARAPLNSP